MTAPVDHLGSAPDRFPLSSTQQWWCAGDVGDQGGTFGPRFTSQVAVRISGRVDVAALQSALDDVVQRHEILRTIVVRDAQPRYQQVYPPAPATLDVRDLPAAGGGSGDVPLQEIITREGRESVHVKSLPLLRAGLNRFDDEDSVLVVTSHHTVADNWSMHVLLRDLAAFYKARVNGHPADLPNAPQYRDFVAWEQSRIAGSASKVTLNYWREKLDGARVFTLPSSRPVHGPYSRPYSARFFSIDPEVTAAIVALSRVMRSSVFMILLSAFNVLTHEITGTTDPVVNTFSSGRHDPRTRELVGSVVNTLPLRTDLDSCVTFRDVLIKTRRTCLEAYSHEIPTDYIEQEAPDLMKSLDDPMLCNFFVFNMPQTLVGDDELGFADSSSEVRKGGVERESESMDLADGFVWAMDLLPSGELMGTLRFNLDEFDESIVAGWESAYRRILCGGVLDPDREWKKL